MTAMKKSAESTLTATLGRTRPVQWRSATLSSGLKRTRSAVKRDIDELKLAGLANTGSGKNEPVRC